MTQRRINLRLCLGLLALAGGFSAFACTLNPQPLPPGEQIGDNRNTDASAPNGSLADAAAATPSGDAGVPKEDAGTFVDAEPGPGDGDATTDAPSDAPSDAPTDAPDGGG